VTIPKEMQGRRDGDAGTSLAVPDKANEVLNWKTELSMQDACRDNWNWCKKNPNGYEGGLKQ